MPASHPRHTITEMSADQQTLESRRAALEAGARLVREIREGTIELDVAAADEVKRLGLIADDER